MPLLADSYCSERGLRPRAISGPEQLQHARIAPSMLGRKSGQRLYYKWSKEFLEAGKNRLSGDTERQATSGEVKELRREMSDLKEALADVLLESRLLKKASLWMGATIHEVSRIRETRNHSPY